MFDSSKYLGVTVANDLSWSQHIDIADTATKAIRSLGFLRGNFKDCSIEVKATTYTTVVRTVLEYASPVWDPHRQTTIKTLDQVQRRAAGCLFNMNITPGCITDTIHEVGWESLEDRRYMARHCLLNIQDTSWFGWHWFSCLPEAKRQSYK